MVVKWWTKGADGIIPLPTFFKFKEMLKKIRFIKDVKYPAGKSDRAGVERLVTRRNAELLIASGDAELVVKETEHIEPEPELKEEKAVRQTKEEKTTRRRRTK